MDKPKEVTSFEGVDPHTERLWWLREIAVAHPSYSYAQLQAEIVKEYSKGVRKQVALKAIKDVRSIPTVQFRRAKVLTSEGFSEKEAREVAKRPFKDKYVKHLRKQHRLTSRKPMESWTTPQLLRNIEAQHKWREQGEIGGDSTYWKKVRELLQRANDDLNDPYVFAKKVKGDRAGQKKRARERRTEQRAEQKYEDGKAYHKKG